MFATKIEYSVGSEFAERNKSNIRQVMAELEKENPEGFSYGVFMKEDGKSFVHLVFSDERAPNVLEKLQSFNC